jgi:rRNA small subunit pseudouridine methyltransferase Nep1
VLTLVLADAELELVPEEVKAHPAVQASAHRRARRAGRTLLDSSPHHAAMQGLPEGDRRGRPDLVHLFLLTAMDSVLNIEGGLRVLVHTRNDELITIAPETRIMRSYDRFCGLMEQLFREGKAGPAEKALLTLEPGVPLEQAVKRTGAERVVALETGGQRVQLDQALPPLAQHGQVAIVLGGFPKGTYRSPVASLAQEVWSLHDQGLSVWVAAAEVLVHWELATRGMAQHRGPAPERPELAGL